MSERCEHCHQRIRPARKYSLNRNCIYYLAKILQVMQQTGNDFIETKETYKIKFAGSNTAENTKLKYLGAITPYYTGHEEEQGVKRSGKWKITEKGYAFLRGTSTLPKYVEVIDEMVIEEGEGFYINDRRLLWYSHQDYWKEVTTELNKANINTLNELRNMEIKQ